MTTAARTLGAVAMGGLTPLVDTLFLLLFALLAISDVRRDDAPREEVLVELPGVAPESGAAVEGHRRIELVVDAESRLTVGEQGWSVANPGELDARLAQLLGAGAPADVAVVIRADRQSRHGVAVALLQHLRTNGYRNVVLVAEGSPDPSLAFGARAEGVR